ncbi:hypothetical protein [Pseudoduganella lutea]|uniref:Uncharacterized protein n=1 Tax=Pseudoduganella lutea TaxID=321985 RepID=A0A4P6L3A5_9BURK|nr:hypothetical protein [Pseudoduganella lutea]QBE65929.1 hypothetical protein EWM63_25520 [Pseudoduganella lutea]
MSLVKSAFSYGALVGIALSVCSGLRAENKTLCKKTEVSLFSCGLSNSKVVSICASENGASNYLEYRYGTASKVELSYKADAEDKKNVFHRAEITYANNAEDTIWFHNGPFMYSIFMPARGIPGIEVSRNKDVIARHECADGWRGAWRKPSKDSPLIIDHGSGDSTKFESLW